MTCERLPWSFLPPCHRRRPVLRVVSGEPGQGCLSTLGPGTAVPTVCKSLLAVSTYRKCHKNAYIRSGKGFSTAGDTNGHGGTKGS
nr:MAG TPA: hypothetical protein [Caudoviricetes sp.]